MLFSITAGMFVYGATFIVFTIKPAWLSKFFCFLQSSQRIIYITTICLGLVVFVVAALTATALSEFIFLGSIGSILQRGVYFLAWLLVSALQFLIMIRLYFKDQIFSREQWRFAFEKLTNSVRTIRPVYWFIPLAAILIVGVYLAVSPAFSGQMPQNDSGIFLYFGSRILKGDIPFRIFGITNRL